MTALRIEIPWPALYDAARQRKTRTVGILRMDREVLEIARLYARKVSDHMPVRMVILYGSHARGTAGRDSDIDIAVVVDRFRGDYLKASAELFDLVRSVNKHIEPVLISRAHDKGGFLESLLKHGKIIYKSSG